MLILIQPVILGNQRNSTFNDTDDNPVEAAAIRIQAAYRGHTVRQNLNSWKLPSGQTVGGHIRRAGQDEVGFVISFRF